MLSVIPAKSFHSRSQFSPQTEWCMHYKDEVIWFCDMREVSMRISLFTLKYKSTIFAQLDSTGKQKTVGSLFICLCFFLFFVFCCNRRFWCSCRVNWSRRPELLPLQAELMCWTSSKVLQEIYSLLYIAVIINLTVTFILTVIY